jgi:hypothetical protein
MFGQPFHGFRFAADESPQPLGLNAAEAKAVAWLLSCSPHLSPSDLSLACERLRYAVRLSRDAAFSRSLYKRLRALPSADIDVRQIEADFGCLLRPFDIAINGQCRSVDPYFRARLDLEIYKSCESYVVELENACVQLGGLERFQLGEKAQNALSRMRRALAVEFSDVMAGRSQKSLVAVLQSLRDEYGAKNVALCKEALQIDLQGYEALGRCAAQLGQPGFDFALHEGDQAIATLVQNPPPAFVAALSKVGATLGELSAAFEVRGDALTAVKEPPPSLFVRSLVLARWLETGGVEAICASHAAAARKACLLAPDKWTDVCIARPPGHPLPVPRHLPPAEARVLVQTQSPHGGVIACRMLDALLQQAKIGLLPPLRVRADVLLPSVARWMAENEFNANSVAMQLQQVADEVGAADFPMLDLAEAHVAPRPSRAPRAPRAPSALSAPALAAPEAPALVTCAGVPVFLWRDHSVLSALSTLLRTCAGSGRIVLSEVSVLVRKLAPSMDLRSEASLKQIIAHVTKRLVARVSHLSGTVSYSPSVLSFDEEGRARLICYADWAIEQMQRRGSAFSKTEWPVSRAAAASARKPISEPKSLSK